MKDRLLMGESPAMDSSDKSDSRSSSIAERNLLREFNPRPDDDTKNKIAKDSFRRRAEITFEGVVELSDNWNDLTIREQRDWVYAQLSSLYPDLPKSLIFLGVASLVVEESEYALREKRPVWLDHDKFLRGQRFARDNLASVSFGQLVSIFGLYLSDEGLDTLISTDKTSHPFAAFKRYYSTAVRVINWYSSDIWDKKSLGYRDIRAVTRMHAIVRKKLINSNCEASHEKSKIKNAWCPVRVKMCDDVRESIILTRRSANLLNLINKFSKLNCINQAEMSLTQFGFFALIILYPEHFGIHGASDDDLDAFCHVWRSVGYLLGIEDEFNFCAGSLEEVKQRSKVFLEVWIKPKMLNVTREWEHMLRCAVEGISYFSNTISYEQTLIFWGEILEIPMPRVRSSINIYSRIEYFLFKMIFRWGTKIPGVRSIMNKRIHMMMRRALNFTTEKLKDLEKHSGHTLYQATDPLKSSFFINEIAILACSETFFYFALLIFLLFVNLLFFK